MDRELRSPPRTYFSPKRLLTDTSRLGDIAVLGHQVRPRWPRTRAPERIAGSMALLRGR